MTQTTQQNDFIKIVANQLAKNFMNLLFELTKEKSYAAHIGGLAEILDWSGEFYDRYYDKVMNAGMFACSNGNIYNDTALHDLIDAFGNERFKKFCAQNENRTNYFAEKYSAISEVSNN